MSKTDKKPVTITCSSDCCRDKDELIDGDKLDACLEKAINKQMKIKKKLSPEFQKRNK